MSQGNPTDHMVLSFLAVRRALGILALALPILLYIYARPLGYGMQPSISEFYHTKVGDILVGTLVAMGVFLISYKGYPRRSGEHIADRPVAIIAGISVIGVALVPVEPPLPTICLLERSSTVEFYGALGITAHWCRFAWIHFAFAAIFFVCLTIFCLFLFPRGDRNDDGSINWGTPENRVYLACGAGLTLSLLALLPYVFAEEDTRNLLRDLNYVYWWQTVAVLCFAISWLRKGNALRGLKNLLG